MTIYHWCATSRPCALYKFVKTSSENVCLSRDVNTMTSAPSCFRVTLACVCLLSAARGLSPTKHKGCLHGGRVLLPGSRFRPDTCTACRCPRRGGQVVCTVEDCQEDPHCLRHVNMTSRRYRSCCPRCAEYGCRHTDGHVYQRGEVISSDGCSHCYCPLKGGASICDVKPCPPTMCVDFVLRPGKCCPQCPRGQNCQLGLRIIPRGHVVTSGGSLCHCRLKRRARGNHKLEAVCFDPNRANLARLFRKLSRRAMEN